MHFQRILAIVLWLSVAVAGSQGQQTAQPNNPSSPKPTDTSPQAVKEATQVLQTAAAQTSQKADDALKQVQATEVKVDETEKKIKATAEKADATQQKVDQLVASEDDDNDHVLRRADAQQNEISALNSRMDNFRNLMQAKSDRYFYGALALVMVGLGCGFGSVVASLKNRGTLSAVLALAVIAAVAFNSFLKIDTKTRIYGSLAAAADSESEKIVRPRIHFGQIIDSEAALARMKAAAGSADTGDINGTLQAFVNNTSVKH